MKIGDTLYCFDRNRRPYDKDKRLIFSQHFVPYLVTGETRLSWLCGERKVNKATLGEAGRGGYVGHQWYTETGKEECIWKEMHAWKIQQAITAATAEQLKRVAEIIGYKAA